MRAKLKTMTAIRARSRRPIRLGGRLSGSPSFGSGPILSGMLSSSLASFVGFEHRRLALFHDVLSGPYGGGGVGVDDLPEIPVSVHHSCPKR